MKVRPLLCAALLLCACGDDSAPASSTTSGTGSTTADASTGSPATSGSTGSADTTSVGSLDGSGTGDSTGSTTTGSATDSSTGMGSSSESGSTGEPNTSGCADGEREALLDEGIFPDIAACSGAWSFPGVTVNTTMCDRDGGDDGPIPTGRGCSVEDLCAEDWHVCESRTEVQDSGIANCDDEFWNGAFFVTRQSGNGSDTCGNVGLNDVFGCGDLGYVDIFSCAPLNRSTGNLCVELDDPPWSCGGADDMEADQLVKDGPEFGGVLCCRD